MLQKAGNHESLLNREDEQLKIDMMKSQKQQQVAEKMLQHANAALIQAVDKDNIVAIKVAKEFVSTATITLEQTNESAREQQNRSSEISLRRKNALEKLFRKAKIARLFCFVAFFFKKQPNIFCFT